MNIDILQSHNERIIKYADVVKKIPASPRPLEALAFVPEPPVLPLEAFLIYFIVVDGSVYKVGQSSSPQSSFLWYKRLSRSMNKGRYIPYFWMIEQIEKGRKVSFWYECFEDAFVEYPHAISGQPVKYLAHFAKAKEKEYLDYIHEIDKEYPLLNRQEKNSREDDFEAYYRNMYKEAGGKVG